MTIADGVKDTAVELLKRNIFLIAFLKLLLLSKILINVYEPYIFIAKTLVLFKWLLSIVKNNNNCILTMVFW